MIGLSAKLGPSQTSIKYLVITLKMLFGLSFEDYSNKLNISEWKFYLLKKPG
jgi:hypothetical protein